jgi:regulatory protein YycI of two-component signal transduction system YycFG
MMKNILIIALISLNIFLCVMFLKRDGTHRSEFDNINTNIINERSEVIQIYFSNISI